jgi:hypothetical protein
MDNWLRFNQQYISTIIGHGHLAQIQSTKYINYHWTWTFGSDSINKIYQLSLDMDIWLIFNQQNISTIIGHGHLAQIQSTKYINYHWTWKFGSRPAPGTVVAQALKLLKDQVSLIEPVEERGRRR